jgi:hypothetical protein
MAREVSGNTQQEMMAREVSGNTQQEMMAGEMSGNTQQEMTADRVSGNWLDNSDNWDLCDCSPDEQDPRGETSLVTSPILKGWIEHWGQEKPWGLLEDLF